MQVTAGRTLTEPTAAPAPEETTRAQIITALDDLPADSLKVVWH